MRLEGTLDAFSLPDIFQLLSFTKKTGTLHLRRDTAHGAIYLREGTVTGARADVSRQELARRLLGAGLVDDEILASAAEDLVGDPDLSLAQLLTARGQLPADTARALAVEQAQDAVFSLLRWPEGEFAFIVDEADPDDLGAVLAVEDVVTECQRRIAAWSELVESLPAPDAVVSVSPVPAGEPITDRAEWALLALVDGRRTVTELVGFSGRGEYAVVSALAGLVSRGLLLLGATDGQQARRQSLLAALEGRTILEVVAPPVVPAEMALAKMALDEELTTSADPAMAPVAQTSLLTDSFSRARPEPFLPSRLPDQDEPVPAYALAATSSATPRSTSGAGGSAHGSVQGATALQPDADTEVVPYIERDPSVNKSLLLRLIAGVRGL